MICPVDDLQMHQLVVDGLPIGAGNSTEDIYQTWTLQKCDSCGRTVYEGYSCRPLTEEEVNQMVKQSKGNYAFARD